MSLLINPAVFREYDIRGIAHDDLSEDFAYRLGLSYAEMLKERILVMGSEKLTVAVGKDCRQSSDRYEEALVNGLTSGGLDVVRLGLCPTPVVYFSLFHLSLDGAIIVTASHNPPEYNGFKICLGRDAIYGERIQELRAFMEAGVDPMGSVGSVSEYDILTPYLEYQRKQFPSLKGKKIVVDCGNGMSSMIASDLMRSLGVEVLELFCNLDGSFPNHIADPTVETNLVDLIKLVKESQADFGIGFDGDADRIGVVDETGRLIPGDELMVIFSREVLKHNPGSTIISEVKSSVRLFDDIEKNGGIPLMWKVGHSHLKEKMRETGALLGGELSGHICFADRYFGFDDAIYAALRLLEISLEKEGPLSSLLSDLPAICSTPEIRIPFEEERKFEFVETVRNVLRKDTKLKKTQMTTIDGIRVDFADGWGLIRASNTQAYVTFRFEAFTKERLNEIRLTFESAVCVACQLMDCPPIKVE